MQLQASSSQWRMLAPSEAYSAVAKSVIRFNITSAKYSYMQRPKATVGQTGQAWNFLRKFILSKHFQAGVQLAAGEVLVSLFFWRSELRYTSQCLLSTLYLLCSLLIPPDNHIGSKWVVCVLLIGSAGLACLLAGTTVCLDLLLCKDASANCTSAAD